MSHHDEMKDYAAELREKYGADTVERYEDFFMGRDTTEATRLAVAQALEARQNAPQPSVELVEFPDGSDPHDREFNEVPGDPDLWDK